MQPEINIRPKSDKSSWLHGWAAGGNSLQSAPEAAQIGRTACGDDQVTQPKRLVGGNRGEPGVEVGGSLHCQHAPPVRAYSVAREEICGEFALRVCRSR